MKSILIDRIIKETKVIKMEGRKNILIPLFEGATIQELDEFVDELAKLMHHKDSTCGLYCIDTDPQKLFDKAMSFKSDSNPFFEDGNLAVKDGYEYCKKSINRYFKEVFFRLKY